MIRSLFLPDKVGSYYLFTNYIAACEITRFSIKACLVKAYGRTRIIEKVVQTPIDNDSSISFQERVQQSLQIVLNELGKKTNLTVVLHSNSAILKEIRVPFTDQEKIKLILPFEIEPLLPFSLADTTIDGIVESSSEKSSFVLAVAVKNEQIVQAIAPFDNINATIDKVTVDIVELYALFKALEPNSTENVILFYMDLDHILLGIVINGTLKSSRLLPGGILKLSKKLGVSVDEMIDSGVSLDQKDLIKDFLVDVDFTLHSFTSKIQELKAFDRVICLGLGVDIKNFCESVTQSLAIPCQEMQANEITQHGIATMTINRLPNNCITPIATALSLPLSQDFNLYRTVQETTEDRIFVSQLIVLGSLIGLILSSIFVNGYLNSRRIKTEITASEQEAISRLKKEFPSISSKFGNKALEQVITAARNEVAREKNIWFALSTQNRASFLLYLQELSTRIDGIGLGLKLKRLSIDENTLTIEGEVKDYEALKDFEENLRQSKLFSSVPRLQELKFNEKLTLDKTTGEN